MEAKLCARGSPDAVQLAEFRANSVRGNYDSPPCLMQLETVTQKRKKKKDNHVYEQRFKPCWITSACLSLLYRSVWLSSDPAWPDHIIQFITTQLDQNHNGAA